MPKPSFPSRLRAHHRPPLTPALLASRQRALLHATGGALLALAVVAVVALHDVPIAALLTSLTLAVAALVVVDPGKHLLAAHAPLPDVHTPPIATATGLIRMVEVVAPPRPKPRPADDDLLAVAVQAGVARHACYTPTARIPQVTA